MSHSRVWTTTILMAAGLFAVAPVYSDKPAAKAPPNTTEVPSAELIHKDLAPIKHDSGLEAMSFSKDGKYLATASSDKTARVWEVATGKPVCEPLQHNAIVVDVAISPDGKFVVSGSRDGTARLWETATGKPIGEPMRHQGTVSAVAFTPDGKRAVTGSDDRTIQTWDPATAEPIGLAFVQRTGMNQIGFLDDGRTMITCCRDNWIRKWDVAARKMTGFLLTEPVGITSLGISRNGRLIFTGSRDKGARVWEAASGKPVCEPFATDIYFTDVALSPDGMLCLGGGNEKREGAGSGPAAAQLWDTATTKPIGDPIRGKNSVAFHPSGTIIATGGDDGIVDLWEIKLRRPERKPPSPETLEANWQDLAGDNVPAAFRAILAMEAAPEKALPFIDAHLQPVAAPGAERIGKLIADLDDESAKIRDKAEKELIALDHAADAQLLAAAEKDLPQDVQECLHRIVEPEEALAPAGARLRGIRSLQILEEIGNAQARELLQKIAKGVPEAGLTREANAALVRLSARK
jgi:WD40 repeat protein